MQEINRNFGGIDVVIHRKKNLKNIDIRAVGLDGHIVINAPTYISIFEIEMNFMNNIEKIKKIQQEAIDAEKKRQENLLADGSDMYLLGKKYILRLKYVEDSYKMMIDDNEIILEIPFGCTYEIKEKLFLECCRTYLKWILPQYVKRCEEITGLHANEYRIKLMKTRWGSCNVNDKRIWLNLKLVFYHEDYLVYVILHELTHLLVPNHSKEFYDQLEKFIPERKKIEEEMKNIERNID